MTQLQDITDIQKRLGAAIQRRSDLGEAIHALALVGAATCLLDAFPNARQLVLGDSDQDVHLVVTERVLDEHGQEIDIYDNDDFYEDDLAYFVDQMLDWRLDEDSCVTPTGTRNNGCWVVDLTAAAELSIPGDA